MLKTVIILLHVTLLYAASFTYKGNTVTTQKTSKEITCKHFSILLETEAFAFKYEGKVPSKFHIPHYYGSDTIIHQKAYFLPNKQEIHMPKSLRKKLAHYNRTYLPTNAVCSDNGFRLNYYSGGNCNICESSADFKVTNDTFTYLSEG